MTRFKHAAVFTLILYIFIQYRYSVYENARPHPVPTPVWSMGLQMILLSRLSMI